MHVRDQVVFSPLLLDSMSLPCSCSLPCKLSAVADLFPAAHSTMSLRQQYTPIFDLPHPAPRTLTLDHKPKTLNLQL